MRDRPFNGCHTETYTFNVKFYLKNGDEFLTVTTRVVAKNSDAAIEKATLKIQSFMSNKTEIRGTDVERAYDR